VGSTSDPAGPFLYTVYFLTTRLWSSFSCRQVCVLTSPAQAIAPTLLPGYVPAHVHTCIQAEVSKPGASVWGTVAFLPALPELEYNFISLARFCLCDHISDTLIEGTEDMCLRLLFRCLHDSWHFCNNCMGLVLGI